MGLEKVFIGAWTPQRVEEKLLQPFIFWSHARHEKDNPKSSVDSLRRHFKVELGLRLRLGLGWGLGLGSGLVLRHLAKFVTEYICLSVCHWVHKLSVRHWVHQFVSTSLSTQIVSTSLISDIINLTVRHWVHQFVSTSLSTSVCTRYEWLSV